MPYRDYRLVFKVEAGSSSESYLAIDDVIVNTGHCRQP